MVLIKVIVFCLIIFNPFIVYSLIDAFIGMSYHLGLFLVLSSIVIWLFVIFNFNKIIASKNLIFYYIVCQVFFVVISFTINLFDAEKNREFFDVKRILSNQLKLEYYNIYEDNEEFLSTTQKGIALMKFSKYMPKEAYSIWKLDANTSKFRKLNFEIRNKLYYTADTDSISVTKVKDSLIYVFNFCIDGDEFNVKSSDYNHYYQKYHLKNITIFLRPVHNISELTIFHKIVFWYFRNFREDLLQLTSKDKAEWWFNKKYYKMIENI